jgi:putative DNA primase/helicase
MRDKLKAELAEAAALKRWCLKMEAAPRIHAIVDLARSEPGVPIAVEELDRDPWLFNCPNGTLELKTGTLREHRREDYITKLCPVAYVPGAPCPRWKQFLDEVFDGKQGLVNFLHRLLGYFLTGSTKEQILPILWGAGANGKTMLVNAILGVMGRDYAFTAARGILTARGERHATERADLFGVRLAVVSETEEGDRLAAALVKDLTGSTPIRARRMREDHWEFLPTHKIVLITNHKPTVREDDDAMWRRLRLVPFEQSFDGDECDKDLPDKLAAEAEGILAWMVRGCLEWQRDGLAPPEEVEKATGDYRESQDVVGSFLEEACTFGQEYRVKASALAAEFKKWCEAIGQRVPSRDALGDALNQVKGVERYTSNGTWYRGVRLRQPNEGSTPADGPDDGWTPF